MVNWSLDLSVLRVCGIGAAIFVGLGVLMWLLGWLFIDEKGSRIGRGLLDALAAVISFGLGIYLAYLGWQATHSILLTILSFLVAVPVWVAILKVIENTKDSWGGE